MRWPCDGAALAIDRAGIGVRLSDRPGPSVFVVKGGTPQSAVPGQPLVYAGLSITKLATDTDAYDFTRRCGRGLVSELSVDGAQPVPYRVDAYDAGTQASCL
jgi:hypothetical protein